MCSAATFYSVSISEPIPIRFGKKILQNSIKFSEPNWIRFGNKKQYLSTEKNSEPNPIRFGKSCNILEKITRLSAHLPNLPDLPTLPT